MLKITDYITASVPVIASLSLAEWNSVIAMCGGILGIAYLCWKWHREASKAE